MGYIIFSTLTMANSAPKIIFGAAPVAMLSEEEMKKWLGVLRDHGVTDIDTAFRYVCDLQHGCLLKIPT